LLGTKLGNILTDHSVSIREHQAETTMQTQPASKTTHSSSEQAILEAAETLFAKKGFDAVSMSAIAKLANTSKPNIYHHFKNKNELYLAVMKAAVQRSSMLLDELEDAPGSFRQHLSDFSVGQLHNILTGTFGQRLSDFSVGQLHNILTHNRSTQLILRETLSGGTQNGQEIARHVVEEVFSRLVAMVQQGQQENEIRNDIDPALAAFMVVAANMFFFQANPIIQTIPEIHFTNDAPAFSAGVMDILFNGVLRKGAKT